MISIQGIDKVLSDYSLQHKNQEIESGVTTLFAENAIIEDYTLKISSDSVLKFGEIAPSEDSRRRLSNPYVTRGTKTFLAVRIVTKDSQTTANMVEISDSIFGTNGDPVNLKSQYEGCSHQNFMVEMATTDNRIVKGVLEIEVDIDSDGKDDGDVRDAVRDELEAMYDVDGTFDHVMLCLPPGTKGDWIGYAYMNDWLSVYNDEWCGYPSIQLVSIRFYFSLQSRNIFCI